MTADTTVLVVGAGPVGLVAAAELARRGVAVRIIDKLASPTSDSRAVAVHPRSLDMLARIGVVDELVATGAKARSMNLHAGPEQLFRIPIEDVHTAYPFTLNTPQTETERVLAAHLSRLGVTVERQVELLQLDQDTDAAHLTLSHPGGVQEKLTVAYVVGADGGHSTVRKLVGDRLQGAFVGQWFLLGDVDAEHDLDTEAMYTFFCPAGPVLFMPMLNGRIRVIANIEKPDESSHQGLAELQAIVDARVGNVRFVRAHWLSSFETHHAQVRKYRWGRVFLAGDAAHVHSPAGGQGMNTGMQDAFNLAWKLAETVSGRAGESLLDSYHAERYPVAETMIKFTERLTTAGTVKGPAQHLRNALLQALSHVRPASEAMAKVITEVNISYRDSPIAVGRAPRGVKIVAGEHFPYLGDNDVQHQLAAAWDSRHAMVTISGDSPIPAPHNEGLQVLITQGDKPVNGYDCIITDPSQIAAQRLGLPRGGRIVVRPDGYIGALVELAKPDAIDDYFATITR